MRKLFKSLKEIPQVGVGTTAKRLVFGSPSSNVSLARLMTYVILTLIGFVYMYPLLQMLSTSLKSLSDLINDGVKWLPTELYWENYKQALEVMSFEQTIVDTVLLAAIPAVLQTLCCCFTGYAIARYKFPGKTLVICLLVLTFVLPKQATMLPTYLMYKQYGMIGTIYAFALPAMTGQGFNAAIVTLVFYQFFSQVSPSVIEAAQMDGCGHFRVFFHIALPGAKAAFIIGFLFSLVWYWNETYLTGLFVTATGLGNAQSMSTLLMELRDFEASYKLLYQGSESTNKINEAIRMAGTMVCICPLLIVYFALQRYFVQSVDMVGIKD